MTVTEIWQRSLDNTGYIGPEIAYRWIQTKEEKNSERDFNEGKERSDVDQIGDCSTQQE